MFRKYAVVYVIIQDYALKVKYIFLLQIDEKR